MNSAKNQICQSCGMQLSKNILGSNSDNSENIEFCKFCFSNGKFVLPELTLEKQIQRLSLMAVEKFHLSKEDALKMATSTLKNLKRWQ